MPKKPTPRREIRELDPASLRPHPQNPRLHDEAAIAHLAHSMQEFGFYGTIVANPKLTILAGHKRALAAQRAGLTRVPVQILSGLTAGRERALLAWDNESVFQSATDGEALDALLASLDRDAQTLLAALDLSLAEEDSVAAPAAQPPPPPPAAELFIACSAGLADRFHAYRDAQDLPSNAATLEALLDAAQVQP